MTPVDTRACRYVLGIPNAVSSIRKFNGQDKLVVSDYLVSQCFDGLDWSDANVNVLPQVLLLDGLWGTQLFRDGAAAEGIAQRLSESARDVGNRLSKLQDDDLRQQPSAVYEATKAVLDIILRRGPGEQRRHYSFATKFLHWCTRRHFPIVDSRARRAINRLQRRTGIGRGRVCSYIAAMDRLTYTKEYERWVWFYSNMINSLSASEREGLLKADKESLSRTPRFFVENSLLRILDKVFYIRGGEQESTEGVGA